MTQPDEPTESIYLPRATVFPALFAFGLAAVIVGLYAWWPYSVIGAFIALFSLIGWLRTNRNEIARMPRRQPSDTAPIALTARCRKGPPANGTAASSTLATRTIVHRPRRFAWRSASRPPSA